MACSFRFLVSSPRCRCPVSKHNRQGIDLTYRYNVPNFKKVEKDYIPINCYNRNRKKHAWNKNRSAWNFHINKTGNKIDEQPSPTSRKTISSQRI